MRIVIVGIGGVGTRIATELPMFLARRHPGSEIVLIDGDEFEWKNRDRQHLPADAIGRNKAVAWAEELSARYPELTITHRDQFVTRDNVELYVPEDSVVFACVDNHASRKLLSDRVSAMSNGQLISGGNDYHDGNAQHHIRRAGVDTTPPITYLHPEIEHPVGKNPAEMSCVERAEAGAPQLQFTNMKVAQEMMGMFYANNEGVEPQYSEVYFDIVKGTQRPIMRRRVEHEPKADAGVGLADRQGAVRSAV